MGVCISHDDDAKLSKRMKAEMRPTPRRVSVSANSEIVNDPVALAALLGGTFIRIDDAESVHVAHSSPKFEPEESVNSFDEIAAGVRAMRSMDNGNIRAGRRIAEEL